MTTPLPDPIDSALQDVTGHHTVRYTVRNRYEGRDTRRDVEVHASPDEIRFLAENGYLVKERIFSPDRLEVLRAALDELVERSEKPIGSWGIILRGLHDKHPDFLEMVPHPPTLSVARAVLGPKVRVRGFTARVSYPGHPDQDTDWHFHQRVIPDPLPSFYSSPQTLDVLIYLDEVTEANGPLSVMPGSHRRLESDLAGGMKTDLPGQVTLTVPAGSAVFTHGSLWHRAHPNRSDGTVRRMLILGYGPCHMQGSIYGGLSPDGLVEQLKRQPDLDEELQELLGMTGYI